MRTRNTLTHPLLIDAILTRDGAWVIQEECTDGSHRPCCLIRFGVGQQYGGLMTRSGMESLARDVIPTSSRLCAGAVLSATNRTLQTSCNTRFGTVSPGFSAPSPKARTLSRSPFNAVLRSTTR